MEIENNKVIYRIRIDDDFSYIGISKNLNKRILQHRLMFKKIFLNFQYILLKNENSIPTNEAFYFKLSCYLWWKNKKLEDFDYEVLEEINYEISEYDLEMKKQDYIAEHNSVLNGFNGAHYLRFKLKSESQNMEPLLKKKYYQKYQENCKFYKEKILKNQFKSPWVLYNFFNSKSKGVEETFWKKWTSFFKEINKKVISLKKENNFLNFLSSVEESEIFKNYHYFNFERVQKWKQNIINSEEELKKNSRSP